MPSITAKGVADDLARLRRPGIGRPLGRLKAEDIPNITTLAERISPDPTLPTTRLVETSIRLALARLFPEQYRLAAAALLWVDLERNEPPIEERKRKSVGLRRAEAAAILGHTSRAFERRHERPLLEALADQLLVVAVPRPRPEPIEPRHPETKRGLSQEALLELLAYYALEVQRAALVPLFIVNLESQLTSITPSCRRLYISGGCTVERYCATDLYNALLALRNSAPSLDSHPWKTTDYQTLLGDRALREIPTLRTELALSLPELTDVTSLSESTLARKESLENLLTQPKDIALVDWYRRQLGYRLENWGYGQPLSEGQVLSPIEVLVAKAGRIERLIRGNVRYLRPLVAEARRLTLKRICGLYLFDDWQPLTGGRSLHDRAEIFVDQSVTNLDRDENVWFN
jgi:hypothetical protein